MYSENIRLKEALKSNHIEIDPMDYETLEPKGWWNSTIKKSLVVFFLVLLALILIACMCLTPYFIVSKSVGRILEVSLKEQSFKMVAERYDDRIQDCNGNSLKISFPDFDYALYGYNIMYGYPLALGRDPGLTHPIFHPDYSEKRQTADCHYSIPKGYYAAPDVSCVTSFSSEVIKDSSQLSSSLSHSAEASGGGWGVKFSASFGFKEKQAQMSSSESVYIISTANCNYYFAMLDEMDPPALHSSLIQAVKNLKEDRDYFTFFDYYGTHFLKYVLFGAKFTYEHEMKKNEFRKESEKGINVAVSASFSGFGISGGGGYSMSQDQKQQQQSFREKVTTKQITVGAPPPISGGATAWASEVKNSPVPVRYKLESIDNLFTSKYMKNTDIQYEEIRLKIIDHLDRYCEYLHKQGKVVECKEPPKDYIEFEGFMLKYSYKQLKTSHGLCQETCSKEPQCIATEYWDDQTCWLYKTKQNEKVMTTIVDKKEKTRVSIFMKAMKLLDKQIQLVATEIIEEDGLETIKTANATMCQNACKRTLFCETLTFFSNLNTEMNCYLFRGNVKQIKQNKDALTFFQPRSSPRSN